MILEVMQRRFLADSTDSIGTSLRIGAETNDPEVQAILQAQEVDPVDVKRAAEWVESLKGRLEKPGERDDATFMPQDQNASLMQSALQRYFFQRNLVEQSVAAGAGAVVHPISDVSLKAAVAMVPPAQLFGAMSQTDVGWASCLFAKAYRKLSKRRPFPDQPAAPRTIADNARVFLIGDWGSGVSRAKKIADRIRTMLLEETTREQHVVHLGDVYYSGWPEEYDDHFLAHWPVRPGEEGKYGSWCLNANHDMFSGGHGYFDHLLADERFKGQQCRSYFSLSTSKWQLLGLDSAWDEGQLAGTQVEWVESCHKAAPDKKLVLMTHHQPFSSFGEKSYTDLQVLYARNKVTAWFWGHEHRFAMYKPKDKLPYGRLIGHGGVPVWVKAPWKIWNVADPPDVAYVSRKGFSSGAEDFLLFGFAVLDFDRDHIGVRYINEYGKEEQSETLS